MQNNHPHITHNVKDQEQLIVQETPIPLHRVIVPIRASKGRVNRPIWCKDRTDARLKFGSNIFSRGHRYYSEGNHYLYSLLQHHGAYVTRLIDDSAHTAMALLCVEFIHQDNKLILQYRQFKDRSDIYDLLGFIPTHHNHLDVETLTNQIRTIDPLITYQENRVTSAGDRVQLDLSSSTILPIVLLAARYPGQPGNELAARININATSNIRLLERIGQRYTIDYFDHSVSQLSRVYSTEGRFDEILVGSQDLLTIPFTYNLKLLAALMSQFTEEVPHFTGLNTVFMNLDKPQLLNELSVYEPFENLNLFGFKDIYDRPYTNIEQLVGDDGCYLMTKIQLAGGSDGLIHQNAVFAEQLDRFYALESVPDLIDEVRYPINQIVDVGYPVKVKQTMVSLTETLKNITAHVNNTVANRYHHLPVESEYGINSELGELDISSLLLTQARNIKESVSKGTENCRVCLYGGVGIDNQTGEPLPLSWIVSLEIAKLDGGQVITGRVDGQMLDDYAAFLSVPGTSDLKELYYQKRVNCVYHLDLNRCFIPITKTVYPDDQSPLFDANVARHITYLKQALVLPWATYAGALTPTTATIEEMARSAERRLKELINGRYRLEVTPTRNNTVDIGLYMRSGLRILNFEYHGFYG